MIGQCKQKVGSYELDPLAKRRTVFSWNGNHNHYEEMNGFVYICFFVII